MLIAALVLATIAGGQAAPELCPPGVPPNTSIRGFDIEDGGGVLTATHISNPADRRRQAFGWELVFRQSARRIGRISAVGRCGALGCRFRTGN